MSKKEKLSEILRNVMKLLSTKNKVLWESAEGWTSGSITVPGIDNYFSVYVEMEGVTGFLCHRAAGGFLGGGVLATWSEGATVTSELRMMASGERLSITVGNLLLHQYGSAHTEKISDIKITKIIGIEPILEKTVEGHRLNERLAALCWLGGVWHDAQRHPTGIDGLYENPSGRRMGVRQVADRSSDLLGDRHEPQRDFSERRRGLLDWTACGPSSRLVRGGSSSLGDRFGEFPGICDHIAKINERIVVGLRGDDDRYRPHGAWDQFVGDWPLEVAPGRGCVA